MKKNETEADYEILSADALKPLFAIDLLKPKYKLYRLNTTKARIYYRENPEYPNGNKYQMFLGTTSVGSLLPMEKTLLYWYAKKGIDEAFEYVRQRAVYGSFYHTIIADISILGELDLDILPDRIIKYAFDNKVPNEVAVEWQEEIQNDILAYCQWVRDFNVKPLAVEIPLASETNGVATLIDMVAWVNDKNYKDTPMEKRTQHLAIIDFKSGKGGFREQHRLQLTACLELFHENFPDHPSVTALYNFAPKSWRSEKPTFTFTNQTDKINQHKYDLYIELARIKLESAIKRPIRVIEGVIKFGETTDRFILHKTIEDIINEDWWLKYVSETPQPEPQTIEE